MGNRAFTEKCWRACAALTLALLFSLLVDFSGVPNSTGHLVDANRLPRLVGALVLLGYAALVALRPGARATRCVGPVLFSFLLAGLICLVTGLITGTALFFSASTWLLALGREWLVVAAYAAVTELDRRAMSFSLVVGFSLAALCFLLLDLAPSGVRIGAFVLSAPIASLLAAPAMTRSCNRARPLTRPEGPSRTRRGVAFLFVFVFLYEAAYGFSLHTAPVSDIPLTTSAGLVPALVLTVYLVAWKRAFPHVPALVVSLLFAIGGLVLAPLQVDGAAFLGGTCLAISLFLFLTSMRSCFCLLGKEHPGLELSLYAASVGIAETGFALGSLLGSRCAAALSSQPALMACMTGAFVIAFSIVCALAFGNATISSLIEARPPSGPQELVTPPASPPEERRDPLPEKQPIAGGLDELAAKHGLSPRETQVFFLLARGRNREYVQEELVISRDTAKAHIKHVYAKLGVHSQQELLDLVDRSLGRGAVE